MDDDPPEAAQLTGLGEGEGSGGKGRGRAQMRPAETRRLGEPVVAGRRWGEESRLSRRRRRRFESGRVGSGSGQKGAGGVGVFVKTRLVQPASSIGAVAVALSRVDSEGRGRSSGAGLQEPVDLGGRSAVLWPPCAPIAALFMHLAAALADPSDHDPSPFCSADRIRNP